MSLDQDWLEQHERQREWVDYAEAVRRLEWKSELAEGLKSSSLAPRAELLTNTKNFFSGRRC